MAYKFLVLLGAPGAGKGTMSELLRDNLGFVHISTGDLLREIVKTKSELADRVSKIMQAGQLVDDQTVIDLIKAKLAVYNAKDLKVIFDGFPRNSSQAQLLTTFLTDTYGIDANYVVNLSVTLDVVLDRLTSRLVCKTCGRIYNKKTLNGVTECSHDGGLLYQRSDDTPEVIESRMKVYNELSSSLYGYYHGKAGVKSLDIDVAGKDKEVIYKEICSFLGE